LRDRRNLAPWEIALPCVRVAGVVPEDASSRASGTRSPLHFGRALAVRGFARPAEASCTTPAPRPLAQKFS